MMDEDFRDYFFQTHQQMFPELNVESYEYVWIDSYSYPIPKPGYKKINKQHSLQEFLMFIFQKYNLAKEALQWIGFIPYDIANDSVKKAKFLMEHSLGSGLFHNKFAHMFQWALILYAILDEQLDLTYGINHDLTISIQDILEGLVTINSPNTPWVKS